VEPEPVDLNALCLSILDLVTPELAGRARLEVDLRPIPAVMGRPKELAQAVLNLLLNARRSVFSAAPLPGTEHEIALETEQRGDNVVLAVTDSGQPREGGNADAPAEFFADGEGFGLSLRLAREILDRSGGHIVTQPTAHGNLVEAFFPVANRSD